VSSFEFDLACSAAVATVADQLGISADSLACGILDLNSETHECGGFQADRNFYPASVVKSFYAYRLAFLVSSGELALTPEIERAAEDMIRDSSNDATALIVDEITNTTVGPELLSEELELWKDQRQKVNRWFTSLGYPSFNACQKTWNEGPYGREKQGYGSDMELRNGLSVNVCLRLMADMMLDSHLPTKWGEWLRALHRRPIGPENPDMQSREFIGGVLPEGWRVWSKAGYMSSHRHDLACVESDRGDRWVLAIFTEGHSENRSVIPSLAKELLTRQIPSF